jgi:hypothetical protein
MSTGALLWLIIFAVSAATFFVVAIIVSINGLGDLRELLSWPKDRK